MKIEFKNRLDAIDWIAEHVKEEGQFEILREQLTYNEIYSGSIYLDFDENELKAEVVMLNSS